MCSHFPLLPSERRFGSSKQNWKPKSKKKNNMNQLTEWKKKKLATLFTSHFMQWTLKPSFWLLFVLGLLFNYHFQIVAHVFGIRHKAVTLYFTTSLVYQWRIHASLHLSKQRRKGNTWKTKQIWVSAMKASSDDVCLICSYIKHLCFSLTFFETNLFTMFVPFQHGTPSPEESPCKHIWSARPP